MKQTKSSTSAQEINVPNADTIRKKSHLPRNKKFFWIFFVLSAIFLGLGVMLLPVWENTSLPWNDFGARFFSLIFSIIIIFYIVGYLFKQIFKEQKTAIKILTVFEAGFFFAVAIGSIMQYFDSASIGGPGTIVGIAFWSRGFVYIVKAYLCKHEENDEYPLWMLIFSVGLVSLGSIMIANTLFTTSLVIWVVAITLLVVALIFLVFGFVSKPKVDKALKALKKEQKKIKKQEKELLKSQKRAQKLEGKVEANSAEAVDGSEPKALLPAEEKTDK
ncbi:MAG: hypothetical protein J6A54_02200 [Clostridia bacterium]|nr:hypothetical protein [Clostridia bacterium]